MKQRSFSDYLSLFFKSIIMGTANKIPGISGGMIALVAGFYEELMYTFQKLNWKALGLLRRCRFSAFLNYINYKFLLVIGGGIIAAFFSVSLIIELMIRPLETGGLGLQTEVWSYFFGLIIGSIYYIWAKSKGWKREHYFWAVAGAIAGLGLSFIDPLSPNDNILFIILCGATSVSGMALPGFSGSFLLVILGNYNLILVDSVNNLLFTITAVIGGDWENLGTTTIAEYNNRILLLRVIAVFTLSSFAGLISFSRIMNFLLKNYHNIVIAILLGFMIGSLGAAWPWKMETVNESNNLMVYKRFLPELQYSIIPSILSIIVGILTLVLILIYEIKNPKNTRP